MNKFATESAKIRKEKLNMENKILLDLQLFAEEGEVADAEVSEPVEPTEETPEADESETGETDGAAEPQPQSAEENARYAAIRRRAEEDARRKYASEIDGLNQQVAAMCQGITHPKTGQPITNIYDYVDALQIQQRQASEAELEEKGIDPSMIDRMIASNPTVMQAQRVIEQSKQAAADAQLQKDIEEISALDPTIKSFNELAALPEFREMLNHVARGASMAEAYKIVNYGKFSDATRQQAINQMRGKSHLATQPQNIGTDDEYVEVPKEIMARMKEDGKTEKQIRDLYKKVAGKLHLN